MSDQKPGAELWAAAKPAARDELVTARPDQAPRDRLIAARPDQAPRDELVTARPDQALRDRLIAARADAVALIAALEADHAGIVEATASTAVDDEHDPEGPTIAFERERTAAMLRQARHTLADLDHAAARLEDGSYGSCAVCHQPITAARLAARPAASTCITCATARRSP